MDTFKQIMQRINPPGELIRTWQLQGGISAIMTTLEIRLPNGQSTRMIVRQPGEAKLTRNPQAAFDEYHLLKTLHAAGLAVPQPYIFDADYLAMEYIDGQPDYNPAHPAEFARQVAKQLARIHQIRDVPGLRLPKQTASLVEHLKLRAEEITTEFDGYPLQSMIEAAEHLPASEEQVLLHGDFWAGNLLWQNDRLVAVIDWEDAHYGHPLMDFATTRLDTLLLFGQNALDEFTGQYQRLMPALDFTPLPYYELYASLRAAPNLTEWASIYPDLGRYDLNESVMRERHQWFTQRLFEQFKSP